MAYRIVYGADMQKKHKSEFNFLQFQVMTAVFLLLFTLGVRQFWPEGTQKLREVLLPDTQNETQSAFETLAENLASGESIGDAVTVFCQEILHDAELEAPPLD